MSEVNKINILGENIYLRGIEQADASQDYVTWLNDPEVMKYTESGKRKYTLADVENYILDMQKDDDTIFCAIVLKSNDKHIGNIKVHRFDPIHLNAEVALMIGDKDSWGKGYGRESIKLISDYVFKNKKIHKLYARCYSVNIGSMKSFKKAGYVDDGIMKEQYLINGEFVDGVQLGYFG